MKIQRQNTSESYNTTVDWLKDFADSIEKRADFINNFKKLKGKDFGTIEEKMADIKRRVGFDIIKTLEDQPQNVKSAAQMCNCAKDGSSGEKCKVCKAKETLTEDGVKILKNFVEYAVDFGKSRPEVSVDAILHECKSHPKLDFNKIEKHINSKALKEMIKSKLSKHRKGNRDEVKYVADDLTDSRLENDLADYMSHAMK